VAKRWDEPEEKEPPKPLNASFDISASSPNVEVLTRNIFEIWLAGILRGHFGELTLRVKL